MVNNKIYLIIIIILATNFIYLFGNEKELETEEDIFQKSIGINIGGSNYIYYRHQIMQVFTQEYEVTDYSDYTVFPIKEWTTKEYLEPYSEFHFLFLGPSFSYDINFSFDYNYSKEKSIGFTVNLGYNFFYCPLFLYYGSNGAIIRMLLRFTKQVKNTESKFLYEMGAVLEIDKYFFPEGNPIECGTTEGSSESSSNGTILEESESEGTIYMYMPELSWGVGPMFVWGMSRTKNSFCFEFGGFLSGLYGTTLIIPNPKDESIPADFKRHNIIIQAGIFFRFNYNVHINRK